MVTCLLLLVVTSATWLHSSQENIAMTGVFYDLPGSAQDRRSARQPDLRHQWWAGTHYTGSVPARSSYINKLPLANAEKCPIPSSINEILRCGVKVS